MVDRVEGPAIKSQLQQASQEGYAQPEQNQSHSRWFRTRLDPK